MFTYRGEATNFRGEATGDRGEATNFRGEASGDRGEATGFRQWPLHKWIHCFQTPSALGSSFDKQNALQQTRKCLEIRALGTSET